MSEDVGERMRALCPDCNRETNCHIHGSLDQPWSHEVEDNASNGQEDHRLLQCLGCDKVFYRISSWHSEDWDGRYNRVTGQEEIYFPSRITTYPEPAKERPTLRPQWAHELWQTDTSLSRILDETYSAAERGSFILASVGLRTALDRTIEILGIDPGHTLEAKLGFLRERGFVGEAEHSILSVVADAGNAAAHRGWSPDAGEFDLLLPALEQFIQRTVVAGNKVLSVKSLIPSRPPRPPKSPAAKKAGLE